MKKVLGRGLDALISQDLRESVSETERVKDLEIDRIAPNPYQPRGRFDEEQLEELAASIRRHGIIQPVVVRRKGEEYELVVGERRLRAAKLAGRTAVPAIVRDVDEKNALVYALLENLQREDLGPIEEARGLEFLKERAGLSVKEIAEMLGKDRSTVANTLRLLALPPQVIEMIESGRLRAGHARALLAIEGEQAQIEWARRAAEDGITVREIERTAQRGRIKRRRRGVRRTDPALGDLEERLEKLLGTRVRISPRRTGGTVTIEYYSDEDLERVVEIMGVETVRNLSPGR